MEMFSNASNFVEGVDTAFVVILGIIFFFLIGLTAVLVYFTIRYRASKNPVATQIEGNNTLEVIWTGVPILIVLGMFYFGWTGWKPMFINIPEEGFHIETTARMWNWSFKYENGKQTDTLYVPMGEPIILDLNAIDVIHSLYIPAFRVKQDMVPGKKGKMWFIANSPGSYDLFCTEYCGLRHSYMYTSVEVLPKEEFDKWYTDTTLVADAGGATGAGVDPDVAAGKNVLQVNGCFSCHSTDGTKLVGPSFKGVWGKEETVITDGDERTITIDEEYVKRSIYKPNADVVEGFNPGLMQSYEGQISQDEIDKIIAYLKSL